MANKKKKRRTESAAKNDFVRICAFVGLALAALLYVVGAILNWLKLSSVTNILNLIAQLALLVAIALPAWDYVKNRARVWKVLYWVALFIYVFGVIFGMIGIYVI